MRPQALQERQIVGAARAEPVQEHDGRQIPAPLRFDQPHAAHVARAVAERAEPGAERRFSESEHASPPRITHSASRTVRFLVPRDTPVALASLSQEVLGSAMRLLLFGGTRFLGRAIAEVALDRGHELTLFHRGRSNAGLWPQAEHVVGDRETDSGRLAGRRFDAAIDTSAFEVFTVRKAARAVGSVPYVFVSSVSVYESAARTGEGDPVRAVDDAEHATLDLQRYGGLKAACERALEEENPGRVLCVRAGKIDGPHDLDERFRYWLVRIAKGGEVLAPGDPDALVQDVDVRDLAAWIVSCAEKGTTGVMNATGEPMTMRAMLETMREVIGSDARFTWVPDEVLLADGVIPYAELPYWLPKSDGALPVPIERAKRAGLAFRPFAETVRDTWAWMRRSWDAEARVRELRRLAIVAGISAERERKLLDSASR